MTSSEEETFLRVLRQCGNVSEAARASGMSRARLYKKKASSKTFSLAWSMALEEAADRLTDEAMRRAVNGFEEVKYFRGEPVGTVRKFSDQLLMFLLKAHRPHLYGHKNTNDDNAETEIHHHAKQSLLKKMETLFPDDDRPGEEESD